MLGVAMLERVVKAMAGETALEYAGSKEVEVEVSGSAPDC